MDIRAIISGQKGVPAADVVGIISHVCSLSKEQIFSASSKEVAQGDVDEINQLIVERKGGKPLAYITGEKEFYSETFIVNEHVLIPRPETELLVDEALRIIREKPGIEGIIDMGTGSGAIGITTAKFSTKHVLCVDNSPQALSTAIANAVRLGAAAKTTFICSDLFDAVEPASRFDLVLANLPYVTEAEWEDLMVDVKNFEPKTALVSGVDGLDVYRRLVKDVRRYLRKGGHLLCEIGGPAQAQAMKDILVPMGFDVSVKNDYAGKERVIRGQWKSSL